MFAVLAGVGMAGCVAEPSDPVGGFAAFTARYRNDPGGTLEVRMSGPQWVPGPDMQPRLAYSLELTISNFSGPLPEAHMRYLVDGVGRVGAVYNGCGDLECERAFSAWNVAGSAAPMGLLPPREASGTESPWASGSFVPSKGHAALSSGGPPRWLLDFAGTLTWDDGPLPTHIAGTASWTRGTVLDLELHRTDLATGQQLPSIPPWPVQLPKTAPKTATPFPSSLDADIFGYGVAAKEAFDELLQRDERALSRLAAGCLHQVSVLPGREPHDASNETNFNFVIANASGQGARWTVRADDRHGSDGFRVDGPLTSHFTTSCRTPEPAPVVDVSAFALQMRRLPLPSQAEVVAWRWDRHVHDPAWDEAMGRTKLGFIFQMPGEDGGPISSPFYLTVRAATGALDAILVPVATYEALSEAAQTSAQFE